MGEREAGCGQALMVQLSVIISVLLMGELKLPLVKMGCSWDVKRFLHLKPMLSPPVLPESPEPVLCLVPRTPHPAGSTPLSSPRGLGAPLCKRKEAAH